MRPDPNATRIDADCVARSANAMKIVDRNSRTKIVPRLSEIISVIIVAGACFISSPSSQAMLPGVFAPIPTSSTTFAGAVPIATRIAGAAPIATRTAAALQLPPRSEFDFTEGHDPHDPATAEIVHRNMQSGHVNVEKSTITGIVDSASMSAALYWTFVLKNNADRDKEASVIIDLPRNSVVNRATLWINGVAQEAAFASNEQVSDAYDLVVVRHRDPLLVTQVGPDQIKILAAPVTAGGGTMKIRLGIAAPIQHDGGRYTVSLPSIAKSNLQFDSKQDVHIASATPIEGLGTSRRPADYVMRANVQIDVLKDAKIFVTAPEEDTVATRLTHAKPGQFVVASNHSGQLTFERVFEKPVGKLLPSEDAANRLSSLWAHGEIEHLAKIGQKQRACELANIYRVVSTVSGAVVLEYENDYYGMNRDMYRIGEQQAPQLQGATNGTIGPVGSDATVISGVNTAGTVRVNYLANLESLLYPIVDLGKLLGLTLAAVLCTIAIVGNGLKLNLTLSKRNALVAAVILAVAATSLPFAFQYFVQTARDANLFS